MGNAFGKGRGERRTGLSTRLWHWVTFQSFSHENFVPQRVAQDDPNKLPVPRTLHKLASFAGALRCVVLEAEGDPDGLPTCRRCKQAKSSDGRKDTDRTGTAVWPEWFSPCADWPIQSHKPQSNQIASTLHLNVLSSVIVLFDLPGGLSMSNGSSAKQVSHIKTMWENILKQI